MKTVIVICCLFVVANAPAFAADFMEKRECTLQVPSHVPMHVPMHTECVVEGGMSNGAIDVKVTTPDLKSHSLFGYFEKKDGWEFDNRPARQTSQKLGEFPLCIKKIDQSLELCLGHRT